MTVPLESEALLAAASKRRDGLTDFGDKSFLPALEALLASINKEGKLSGLGKSLFSERLVESLASRLTLEQYVSRYPEILQESIEQPVFIVGLPRTGTTMLHRVLAQDPRFYTPKWWEVRFPAPFDDTGAEAGEDPRIPAARAEVKMMVEAMPDLLTMHPLDAELADEEVVLMEHSFLSAMYAYANVPGYTAWLGEQDQTPAYTYLKRQLQFLQWQKRRRGEVAQRWILKAPHHTHAMDVLFKVFPDAKIIQTHRDPLETIPSMSSFAYTIWCVYSDDANPAEAAALWSAKFSRGLKDAIRVRDELSDSLFLDVWYLDAVARPMEVIERIYPFLGVELDDEARGRMQKWIGLSSRDKRAPHDYSLEKMALTKSKLESDFASYRERYILPRLSAAKKAEAV
ncbi:sulfotransferase family protein [Paraburkholderia sacchari]|uniref:Sulfotransferase n=1 Tax=Paraburkholderia sacchari TaxID=159450 RepID=A0A8T6ZJ38_9BURK|nr:sulfotransferase [Paraburkholderia sacchari]NLP64841.1 sulfotransferase [Paraburkholderia sacchari]